MSCTVYHVVIVGSTVSYALVAVLDVDRNKTVEIS